MKLDQAKISAALYRQMDRELIRARDAIDNITFSYHREGRSGGSQYYVEAARSIICSFREASERSAVTLAEITQSDAPLYGAALGDGLEAFGSRFVSTYTDATGGSFMARLQDAHVDEIKHQIAECIRGTLEDLELGLAGGVNVDKNKSHIVHIDNRGGHGQFAVNSHHVQQTEEQTHFIDVPAIQGVLAQLRDAASRADLQPAHKDKIDDDIVAIEHELASPTPDRGRISRTLSRLGEFSSSVGSGALGGVATQIVLLATGLN